MRDHSAEKAPQQSNAAMKTGLGDGDGGFSVVSNYLCTRTCTTNTKQTSCMYILSCRYVWSCHVDCRRCQEIEVLFCITFWKAPLGGVPVEAVFLFVFLTLPGTGGLRYR